MFAKLLKMEFRAVWNVLGILCLSLLGAGLLGGGALRYLIWASENMRELEWLEILCVLSLIAVFLFFALCGTAALILLIVRFYRSRFTDEGYLTFTLPVTTHQILLSSFVSSALNLIIVGAVVCVSILLMGLCVVIGADGFWRDAAKLWAELPAVWERLMNEDFLRILWLLLANVSTNLASEVVLVMLCVTIGSLIAKKHRILAAVAFYYILHFAVYIISGISLFRLADRPENLFGLWSVINLGIAIAGYFLMHYLVDKKLNLN